MFLHLPEPGAKLKSTGVRCVESPEAVCTATRGRVKEGSNWMNDDNVKKVGLDSEER